MSRTVLTLVRHGETPANLDGVWHGSIDTPLTHRGRAQAARVATYLDETYGDVEGLYTSPLRRARHTADPISRRLGLPVGVDRDLREYDLGGWEGRSYRSLERDDRFFEQIRGDPDFAPHGGETPRQVTERLVGALLRIAGAHPEGRVVIVTHGGALAMATAQLVAGDYARWGRVMDNCAVSELVLEPRPALLSFNARDHLLGL